MSAYYSRNQSYSRSYRAEVAEKEGRLPLTRAIARVAETAVTTSAIARRVLTAIGSTEWHHVGKYANQVDYYETERAIRIARRVTPAKTRATIFRRWTRQAWAEAREAQTARQLRDAQRGSEESARQNWRERVADRKLAEAIEAMTRDADRAALGTGLLTNYRRHFTFGRALALMSMGFDLSALGV